MLLDYNIFHTKCDIALFQAKEMKEIIYFFSFIFIHQLFICYLFSSRDPDTVFKDINIDDEIKNILVKNIQRRFALNFLLTLLFLLSSSYQCPPFTGPLMALPIFCLYNISSPLVTKLLIIQLINYADWHLNPWRSELIWRLLASTTMVLMPSRKPSRLVRTVAAKTSPSM